MKTAAQITGGAQSLLPLSFDIQNIFEEYLSGEYKTFLCLLQVVEPYILCTEKSEGGRGRPPHRACCFIHGGLAKRRFHIDKTDDLITRPRSDPDMRLLCGFKKVPRKPTFSRAFARLSSTPVFDFALDTLIKDAHKDLIVYHMYAGTPQRYRRGRSCGRKLVCGDVKKQRGHIETWKGYKLHLDVSDTGFPLTARPPLARKKRAV